MASKRTRQRSPGTLHVPNGTRKYPAERCTERKEAKIEPMKMSNAVDLKEKLRLRI